MDTVLVRVAGHEFIEFSEFTIEADLYSMADSFSFTGANPAFGLVSCGSWVDVFVGGEQIMRGCVMTVSSSVSRRGRSYTFSGTDVCGVLEKVQYGKYKTLTNIGIEEAAMLLTADLNWVKRLSFRVDAKAQPVAKRKKFVIEPGQSVAERLSNLAVMRGLLMYAEPSGEIVFGKVVSGGAPVHSVNVGSDMVTESTCSISISGGGSSVTVTSQEDTTGSSRERFVLAVPDFPAVDMPLIMVIEGDDSTPKHLAYGRVEEIRRELFSYEISVVGFRCGLGNIWGINKLVHVKDRMHGADLVKTLVCIKRTFSKSRSSGTTTKLTFSVPALKG